VGGVRGVKSETEQLAELRVIQKRLWKEHLMGSAVVIDLGDVPALTVGGGAQITAASGYDLWSQGQLTRPDLSVTEAVDALVASRPVEVRGR
jgi:hypothetical protein